MTYPATILATPGLLSYYRLGEASAVPAVDQQGRANGVYGGSPTFAVPGLISADPDTAVSFNGTSAFVDISDSGLPTGAAARTLEAWINTTDGSGSGRGVVGYGSQTTGNDFEMRNYFGALALVVRPTVYTFNGVVNAGRTHLVITYDGTNARGYINAVQPSLEIPLTPATILAGATGLEIGVWSNFFLGVIDDVAIYNRALSPAEVTAHYKAGVLGAFTPVLLLSPL